MASYKKSQRILRYEGFGFLTLIVLSWTNELLDLPRYLKGYATPVNWRESCIETVLILIVWFSVHSATKRLLSQLHYLEGFLKVCSWCRRIKHEESWLPIEEYFSQGMAITTTHGICPDCKEKILNDSKGAGQ